ncbi:uncharacterized protein LAJ45_10563 [Morchella importuna]|uniref:uncharacterized protein n=1 Tax=Morchella importuna TaxID=1174673 RepID=UPI001E8E9F62|nr:uncharacterized protein LAJ45_10563 [Morchella importuna]KAH8145441.1 hypothetical protein LAJ45_10563 [Morchella importuna]
MNPARLSLTTLRVAVRSSNRHIQRRGLATLSSEPVNVVAEPKPSSFSPLQDALAAKESRNNWTKAEIESIYNTGALELAFAAATIHRRFHNPSSIQMCTLMNIKTGGCSEDCSYCSQSSRYDTGLKATKLSNVEAVLEAAKIAKANGSTRFCMGAAWRDMRGRKTNLKRIKEMVSGVRAMDMEVCVTLGMIDDEQAKELKEAGLTAYNHNIDTSREHYPKGTPLGDTKPLPFTSILKTISTARCIMPTSIIRLAAGRITMSEEQQALCFMAGANAIFTGERMLTTDCSGWDEDKAMFDRWGLRPMRSFVKDEITAP